MSLLIVILYLFFLIAIRIPNEPALYEALNSVIRFFNFTILPEDPIFGTWYYP
jgi:hypothetical protein